jgi:hypothetical protein
MFGGVGLAVLFGLGHGMLLNSPARRSSSSVFWSLTLTRLATTFVIQDELLTPFYLSPTQNILPFTQLTLKLFVCGEISAFSYIEIKNLVHNQQIDWIEAA